MQELFDFLTTFTMRKMEAEKAAVARALNEQARVDLLYKQQQEKLRAANKRRNSRRTSNNSRSSSSSSSSSRFHFMGANGTRFA